MKYMLLVHLDGEKMSKQSREQWAQLDRDSIAYDQELRQRGHYIMSSALQDPNSAVIVRRTGEEVSTTDGPFVETKEHLGGFIFVEARDLNEAIQIAAKIPVGKFGAIEVRPELVIDPDAR
jgi:hypothetical protein